MSLDGALGIAAQNLAAIGLGFDVISNNIANEGTATYAAEETTQTSLEAGGVGFGVAQGPVITAQDPSLQNALYAQNAAAGAADTQNAALAALQPVSGAVGSGSDIGGLLTNVQSAFSTLLSDPSNTNDQEAVVSSAQALTGQINTLATAVNGARQNAQDSLVQQVGTLDTALSQVGEISNQIIALQAEGQSTAALVNERNAALGTISGLVDARFVTASNGDVQIYTAGGATLPIRSATGGPLAQGEPLSIAAAQVSPQTSYASGGLPGIVLDGQDITGSLQGGSIGANITLRDTTLPGYQAGLDEFSATLANRFAAQGLSLFSDASGAVPAQGSAAPGQPAQTGYVGFAQQITVNPAITANPALVRDGNVTIAGSATGASAFTPNPTGEAGFTGLIDRVVNYALGNDAQDGVAQTAPAVSGLGPDGTLALPFAAPATLTDFANALTASQAADSATASTAATDAGTVQTSLSGQLNSATGVNIDSQLTLLVQLQNAYGANAKIIDTVQQAFSQLLSAVQ